MTAGGFGRTGDALASPLLQVDEGVGWAGWLFLTLLVLILIGLVLGLFLALWRSGPAAGRNSAPAVGGAASAQQLLDERYAKGEIDEIEYLHRRAVLRGS